MGLLNNYRDSALQLAKRSGFASSVASIIRDVILAEKRICSTNLEVLSLLHFAAGTGNPELLQMIIQNSTEYTNKHDGLGLTPVLVAVKAGHAETFCLLILAGADISVRSRDGHRVVAILQDQACASDRNQFEKIMLDALLAHKLIGSSEFRALHFAAWIGDLPALIKLLKIGFHVNTLDENGDAPLMLAAKGGHADACKLFLQRGSDCGVTNKRGEAALSLARKSIKAKLAEGMIFDHLARSHVLSGEELHKYTREGRGSLHVKAVRMLKSGLSTWGKSRRRNVPCKKAVAGPKANFVKNRRNSRGDKTM